VFALGSSLMILLGSCEMTPYPSLYRRASLMANSLANFKSWGSVARMKLRDRLAQREPLFYTTGFLSLFHGSVNSISVILTCDIIVYKMVFFSLSCYPELSCQDLETLYHSICQKIYRPARKGNLPGVY